MSVKEERLAMEKLECVQVQIADQFPDDDPNDLIDPEFGTRGDAIELGLDPDACSGFLVEHFGNGPSDHWLNISTAKADGQGLDIHWAKLSELDQLQDVADRLHGQSVWFSCATRRTNTGNKRGGGADAVAVPGMWLDVDIDGPGHHTSSNGKTLATDADHAWRIVNAFGPPPSFVIDSGGGLQAWWLFHELTDIADLADDYNIAWWETWRQTGIEHGVNLDNVSDWGRMMRLSGSVNDKIDGNPRPVVTLLDDPHVRYNPDDLEQFFREPLPTPAPAQRYQHTSADLDGMPGTDYAQRVPVESELVALGYTLTGENNDGRSWLRSGSSNAQSGRVFADSGKYYQHSDGCPVIPQGGPYNSFDVYTLRNHGDLNQENRSAAATELRRQGYGSDRGEITTATQAVDVNPAESAPAELEVIEPRENRLKQHLRYGRDVRNIPQADPLIEGYLDLNSVSVLFAPSGAGKTFVALDIACCVAYGHDWHGQETTHGKVLYLYLEGAANAGVRHDAWLAAHPTVAYDNAQLGFLTAHDFNMYAPARGDLVAPLNNDMLDVLEIIAEVEPKLIVIDTYAVATTGSDENRAEHVGVIVQHLKTMKAAASAAVLVVHHPGKDESKGMRGSNALFGAADAVFSVSATGSADLTMVSVKHKDRATGQDSKHFRLQGFGESVAVVDRCHPNDSLDASSSPFKQRLLDTAIEALELVDEGQGAQKKAWMSTTNDLLREAGEKTIADTWFQKVRRHLVDRGDVVQLSGRLPKYSTAVSAQAALGGME